MCCVSFGSCDGVVEFWWSSVVIGCRLVELSWCGG